MCNSLDRNRKKEQTSLEKDTSDKQTILSPDPSTFLVKAPYVIFRKIIMITHSFFPFLLSVLFFQNSVQNSLLVQLEFDLKF